MCLTMLGRELKRCSIFHSLAGFNELGVHNFALTGGLSLRSVRICKMRKFVSLLMAFVLRKNLSFSVMQEWIILHNVEVYVVYNFMWMCYFLDEKKKLICVDRFIIIINIIIIFYLYECKLKGAYFELVCIELFCL